MFTGIIEELGCVKSSVRSGQSIRLCIECKKVGCDLFEGQSIAVDGVCLTVTDICRKQDVWVFYADVMPETFRYTTIPLLHRGSEVNLERAMKADARFGGHIVAGHIDGTGIIRSAVKKETEILFTIGAPSSILSGIVNKGSVAVDGISLTVPEVEYAGGRDGTFSVSVIPHTSQVTGITGKSYGSVVNIECDVIGKYVHKYLSDIQNLKKIQEIQNG